MSNHDPIYATSFLQTPYERKMAVGSTILAAHKTKTSIFQLLVHPTGDGNTLVSTATAACIKGINMCIYPLLILGSDQ